MKRDNNIIVNIIKLLVLVILIFGIAAIVGCDLQELDRFKYSGDISGDILAGFSGNFIEELSSQEIEEQTIELEGNSIFEDLVSETINEEVNAETTSSNNEEETQEIKVEDKADTQVADDGRSKYNAEMATYRLYATTAVNIRTQKNTTSDKIGMYRDGDPADVITNEFGWNVVIYNGQIGYAKASYFTVDKPIHNEKELKVVDRGIDPSKPMVALTFDDGPNPNSTPRILDALENNKAVATFFDLGYLVDRYPEVTKREEAIGCEVGNHSYNHKNFNKLSAESMKNDMESSEKIFEKVLGHKTTLFRPPYGNDNSTVKSTLDYPLIRWNIDTLDWKSRNKNKILAKVRGYANLDGCIVLMHSIYGTTADAVEVLVPELIQKGYQLVTVSELAYYRGYESLRCGVEYYEFKK